MYLLQQLEFHFSGKGSLALILALLVGFVAWIGHMFKTQRTLVRDLKKMATKEDLERSLNNLRRELNLPIQAETNDHNRS